MISPDAFDSSKEDTERRGFSLETAVLLTQPAVTKIKLKLKGFFFYYSPSIFYENQFMAKQVFMGNMQANSPIITANYMSQLENQSTHVPKPCTL